MKAQRPYLYKAIYEWIVDNDWTPYLLVDASDDRVLVPVSFVKDGKIVLNISISAIHGFSQNEIGIQFSARFSGKNENLYIPYSAMIALYARENAQGMVFPSELIYMSEKEEKSDEEVRPPINKSKPTFTVIK